MSSFFAYTVCITLGYTWQFALTAVFIEGIIFILLTISNLREKIVHAIPGTTAGAILGSCTITTFVESSSGVGVGGRTGLTAFTASICFLLSLFLAPFFLAVPGAATAPVLILVGLMMLSAIKDINFDDYAEAIPAFICVLFMPATYSISEGIVLSVISYVLINLICGKRKNVSLATILLAIVFMLKYIM